MGPNRTINMSGTGATDVAPVQNTSAAPPENIMAQGVSEKKKGGKGMLYGMILLAVLAIGGIGFGVWAYMDGETQKNNLNEEIDSLKKQNNDLMNQLSDDASVDIDTGSDADTADYIYVGEWGLKIKIPEELKMVSYRFQHYKYSGQEDVTSVTVAGTMDDMDILPDFGRIEKCDGLGSIGRLEKGTETLERGLVFSDDYYDYYYSHPQVTCSVDQSEQELENTVTDVIEQMLKNKENYSKI